MNKETIQKARDQWQGTLAILKVHGERDDVLNKCAIHYCAGFETGYKQAEKSSAKDGLQELLEKCCSSVQVYSYVSKSGATKWYCRLGGIVEEGDTPLEAVERCVKLIAPPRSNNETNTDKADRLDAPA